MLEAFAKLFAPRPLIYVFPNLTGYWYCADEEPGSYRIIVGISLELFEDVRDVILEKTGHYINERCDVIYTDQVAMVTERRPTPAIMKAIKAREIVIQPQPLL